jgi:hypothetical protein
MATLPVSERRRAAGSKPERKFELLGNPALGPGVVLLILGNEYEVHILSPIGKVFRLR